MNILSQFPENLYAFPGLEKVSPIGRAGYLITFTGNNHPDDETTHYNYTLINLDVSVDIAIDFSTDIAGNVVDVQQGKFTPIEALAVRVEGMSVSDFWVSEVKR